MVTKVFIDGEAGTTGLQIRERLANRNDIESIRLNDLQRKDSDARCDALNRADVAILCLPDVAAKEAVSLVESESTTIIDASSAHRVNPDWVYGFAEMVPNQAERITTARKISNPGCYPQGVIAVLRPLIEVGLLNADAPVVCNAISGYSGGGRKMIEQYENDPKSNSMYQPYGLNFSHKHLPEMTTYSGLKNQPIFQPVVGNFKQGMLTSTPLHYSAMTEEVSGQAIHRILTDWYSNAEKIEVATLVESDRLEELDPQSLNNTDNMRIHVFSDDKRGQVILFAVYDNLGKGAAGAAVQNLDLVLNNKS